MISSFAIPMRLFIVVMENVLKIFAFLILIVLFQTVLLFNVNRMSATIKLILIILAKSAVKP